ncbi:NifU family protein [Rickettsia endosymbiont of Cardiosporidium cionae]|uniref:NifU family protein n=1 Tax=Rickettsia endosymbiont of Cardiosporidium cionae TaxID=2777155 RepID=UPI0018953920|nr:NifU family protein [Rickettsia endosymbiont of Cardiosporidium cionae]KAF8818892.1 NifU family protein [Rickettsia endosymbiont of Cardiosporidium cionae]
MFIQTEDTPNLNAMKFIPGIIVSQDETVFFRNIEETQNRSLLAFKLFKIEYVVSVFFGYDFITVTKSEKILWDILKPEILMVIMDHILAELPIIEQVSEAQLVNYSELDLSDIEKKIVEIINNRIRPAVAMDGGDIIYHNFVEGVVYLELHGACSGCPSSEITLKNGIESMLKHFIPEIKSVKAVNS